MQSHFYSNYRNFFCILITETSALLFFIQLDFLLIPVITDLLLLFILNIS